MNAPPLSLPFRISTYTTLAVACLALGYSEYDLVPESIAFTAVVVISLIVSFFLEGRFSLGLGKANLLGLGIGIIAVGWLAVKLSRPATSALANLAWPANLLPYMGPLVMILIPAKLFRPKHTGDWWTMQGVALATVVLATSMSDDPFFLLLVAIYSATAVWSLSLFLSNRSTGAIPALPGKAGVLPQSMGAIAGASNGERGSWWHALLWLGAASLVALPIFFLSPRSTGDRWAFTKSRLETGYNPESTHDMGKSGDLETNTEIAFEVTATNRDGSPKTDIDPDQLWRGASYSDYENGSWIRKPYVTGHSARFRSQAPGTVYDPPDLGPSQYDLEFLGSEKVAGPVLASPLLWADNAQTPVATSTNETRVAWPTLYDGSFFSPKISGRHRQQYIQRTRVPAEHDLGPPMEPSGTGLTGAAEPERVVLTRMGITKIRDWAIELLKKCVTSGRLPQEVIDTADRRALFVVQPEYHEQVARVFQDYFANSGEYEYSTKLRRVDRKADPIEDFLLHAKSGHCERFAAGLALSLRGLGIATQFVVGFKGFEVADNGKYVIRQGHAHAWVEVLVPRPAPADFTFKNPNHAKANRVWHWLSLDPTTGSATVQVNNGNWFDNARQKSVAFINDFIIGYNPAKREEAVEAIEENWMEWSLYLAGGLAFVWLIVFARKRWVRRVTMRPQQLGIDLPWYRQYLAALLTRGQIPKEGQTPKEFADQVATFLLTTPAATVSTVPGFVASKLYRVRYAGSPLTAGEEAEVLAAVVSLETALRTISSTFQLDTR